MGKFDLLIDLWYTDTSMGMLVSILRIGLCSHGYYVLRFPIKLGFLNSGHVDASAI